MIATAIMDQLLQAFTVVLGSYFLLRKARVSMLNWEPILIPFPRWISLLHKFCCRYSATYDHIAFVSVEIMHVLNWGGGGGSLYLS